jgi:hypothetical protein
MARVERCGDGLFQARIGLLVCDDDATLWRIAKLGRSRCAIKHRPHPIVHSAAGAFA